MSSLGEATQTKQSVIQCDAVYKIFGENAKKMLQSANGNVDAKSFQEAGCIVGVNNASFEVQEGDLLPVMERQYFLIRFCEAIRQNSETPYPFCYV